MICKTLRGNEVTEGIDLDFSKRQWGMSREHKLLAATAMEQPIMRCGAFRTAHGVVLSEKRSDDDTDREIVLVQEYETGTGAKRWPGFSVNTDGLTIISSVSTYGGSGYERWLLVIAPRGWSENIAIQFVNERDEGSQVLSFIEAHERKNERPVTAMAVAFAKK